jgi:hypothetical protein
MRLFAIARYLLEPLKASPLLSILGFSLALTLAEQVGVVGIELFLITALLFFCYGFALLDHAMEGRREPLVLSTDMLGTFATRSIGSLLLVIIFYCATEKLRQWLHPAVIFTLRLLLIALFPVLIGGMIMTGQFIAALNPVAALGTIARIPATYAALVLVLCAAWAVPLWVLHSSTFSLGSLWRADSFLPTQVFGLIGGMRGVLIGLLAHIVGVYLWLATFVCIGGTLYESRWELDIKAAAAPERKIERANAELARERDRTMDQLHAELRGGYFVKARDSVRKLVAQSPQPIDEYRWLYARAAKFTDQRLADHLAQMLLPLLLQRRATGEALQIARQRLAVSTQFRPSTDDQLRRLAELARAAGDPATASKLLAEVEAQASSAAPPSGTRPPE